MGTSIVLVNKTETIETIDFSYHENMGNTTYTMEVLNSRTQGSFQVQTKLKPTQYSGTNVQWMHEFLGIA